MKKLIFVALAVIMISNHAKSQLQMDAQGEVGIGQFWGGEPRRLLDVNGYSYFSCVPASSGFYFESYGSAPIILPQWNHSAYLGRYDRELWRIYTEYIRVKGVYLSSDKKIKENIRPLTGSLNNLSKLKAVKFDYKADLYSDSLDFKKDELKAKRKDHSGFIAQELQAVYPKLVEYNDEADMLEINYIGLIPELVGALQEQKVIIESLQSEIKELKKQSNGGSKLKSATTPNNSNFENISENTLYQNSPNPFSTSTTIQYYLSESTKNAMIYIYDMNGTQLNSFDLHQLGYGSITINGGEYNAGMYMYALIADGQVIDTKQMILTD